jgi:hypothetical protein
MRNDLGAKQTGLDEYFRRKIRCYSAAAIRSLYAKGWIEFVEEHLVGNETQRTVFAPDNIDELLSIPDNWYPENANGVRICVVATDAGRDGYYEKYSRL